MTVHYEVGFCRAVIGPGRCNVCRRWWVVIVSCIAEWTEIVVIGFRRESFSDYCDCIGVVVGGGFFFFFIYYFSCDFIIIIISGFVFCILL